MALSVLLLCLVQLQLEALADGDTRFQPPIFTRTDGGRAQCWPPNSYYAQTVSLSLPRGETRPEDDVLPVFLFRLRSNSDADRPGEVVGFILGVPGSQPMLGVTFTNEHDGLHVRACPQPADGPSSCRTKSRRSSDGVPIEVRFPFVQVITAIWLNRIDRPAHAPSRILVCSGHPRNGAGWLVRGSSFGLHSEYRLHPHERRRSHDGLRVRRCGLLRRATEHATHPE